MSLGNLSMKTFVLIASLIVNIWFGFVIVKLERFHYSTQIGICGNYKNELERFDVVKCLENNQPRTSDWWNLYYALTNK